MSMNFSRGFPRASAYLFQHRRTLPSQNTPKREVSEEQRIPAMGDDVHIYIFPNDLHHSKIVGGDRKNDDAILIIIGRLNFSQIGTDPVVYFDRTVCQKDRLLDTGATFTDKVLDYQPTNLIALNVIHYKKQHPVTLFSDILCQSKNIPYPTFEGLHIVTLIPYLKPGAVPNPGLNEFSHLLHKRERRFLRSRHTTLRL